MIRKGATIKPMFKLPRDPSACWPWIGAKNEQGRPVKTVDGTNVSGQRWLWETVFGVLPKSLHVTTSCGNMACANLYHLRCATQADIKREYNSGLTASDVAEMRQLAIHGGVPNDILAKRFGCHPSTVCKIVRRKRWARAAA
jgi:hypothetical protein